MNEFQFKTNKGDILKSMMRRPESAKLIKEAMGSPIGSSSRAKAKKLFSIMEKLHASHDGSGGPGMMYERMDQAPMPEMDPVHIPTDESKGMIIFHKVPEPNITYGNKASKFKPRAGSFDGSGGPGVYDGKGGLFDDLGSMLSVFTTPFAPTANSTPSTSSAYSSLFTPPSNAVSPFNLFSSPNTPTAPTPASSSSFTPNMSTINGPAFAAPNGQITYQNTPKTPAPAPQAPSYAFSTPSPLATYSNLNMSVANSTPATMAPNMSTLNGPVYSPPPSTAPYSSVSAPVVTPTTPKIPGAGAAYNSGGSSAAKNYATFLNVDPNTPLSQIISTQGMPAILAAIKRNEGSSPAGVINNPGNIKYAGLPGQTDSGVRATDGGTFASYATAAEGDNAIASIVQNAASGNSTSYGPSPTLQSFADKYTGSGGSAGAGSPNGSGSNPTPGNYSGLSALAQAAVKNSTGAGAFAFQELTNPADPITGGKTLGQENAALWDKYNIGGLQSQMVQAQAEGARLPQDVTAYIIGRDQYLKKTDQQISDFISNVMNNTDMSNPANAQKANAQLNYLYTLRGRQNQSYIGYLNDAVTQHQAELDNMTNQYNVALNAYNTAVTNNTADYKTYAQALSDMYTAVEAAPLKAQQARLYEAQILGANATAASDATKSSAQSGFITQANKLEGYVWDTKHYVVPGVDLVKTIQDFSSLDPSIDPANIIETYSQGVNNYLNAYVDPTATSPDSVTVTKQKKIAEAAITQYAHLAIAGQNNPNTVTLAQQYANDTATHLGHVVGGELTGVAPKLMEAIKTLAPTGWFGGAKASPTEAEFITNVKNATGNDALAVSMASAIYATFARFVKDGGTPSAAVNAFLYPTSSTSDRGAPAPYTPDAFAQNIGAIYAANLVTAAFATQ